MWEHSEWETGLDIIPVSHPFGLQRKKQSVFHGLFLLFLIYTMPLAFFRE